MKKIFSVVIITLITFGFSISLYPITLGASSIVKKPKFTRTQTIFSDNEILDAANSSYKYPVHFYKQKLEGSIYYENERNHEQQIWTELCTDDKAQALEWSEKHNRESSVQRDLVKERKTEKYFEFKRVNPKRPTDIILSRVHRCSYIDRTQFNRAVNGSMLGVFNKRPTTRKVKNLIEYLWFVHNYNSASNKVLTSFTTNQNSFVQHVLYELKTVGGDFGTCDEITLVESIYTVQKESGEITLASQKNIRTIDGRCYDGDA